MHVTRNRPRRADEILDGGSIYWIIKGVMIARQKIIDLVEVQRADGRPACGLVLRVRNWSPQPLQKCAFFRAGVISRPKMRLLI